MICTGAIPPNVIYGMEMYQAYMKAMTECYYAWCALSGLTYWSGIMRDQQQKSESK